MKPWGRLLAGCSAAVLATAGCREPETVGVFGGIRAAPAEVSFPATYVGKRAVTSFELQNTTPATLALAWTAATSPFELVGAPESIRPGQVKVTVAFLPSAETAFTGELRVRADGYRELAVLLSGSGKPIPPCPTAVTCHGARFELEAEACVEEPVPNGTACDPGNACILDAHCEEGACTGTPRVCDDGNACTIDACSAIDGCQFLPAPPCLGDGRCQLGVCDPQTGCGFARAPDGTVCDPDATSCASAMVCMSGACVARPPPSGFVCAEATPCRGQGTCQGTTCVQPDPVPLAPTWTFDASLLPDPGDGSTELHDFVLEPSGAVSLSGWFARPIFRANTPGRLPAEASARRCILWNARTLCLDYPWPGVNGKVALIDLATGIPMWSFDLPTERPDFAAQAEPSLLYLARIAVQGTDRFAALFEAYPKGAGYSTNCRAYFLVLLDAHGRMIHASRLADPMLDRCDHPHPYGFSADAGGNIYILFSPSLVEQAPLEPGTPAVVLAYDHNAAQLWKRDLDIRGGELAVANGILYPEQGASPLRASTGEVLPPVVRWGRAVASGDTVVQAPPPLGFGRGNVLRAFSAPGLAPKWTYTLPLPAVFLSYEIRLTDWQPRAEARRELVVLGFDGALDGEPELRALRVRDGNVAWTCPLSYPVAGVPDLFETDRGHLALMAGSQTCGRCDPPYAHSKSTFLVYPTPGLYPSNVPWPGTFGGPAHDGQELPILSAGAKSGDRSPEGAPGVR